MSQTKPLEAPGFAHPPPSQSLPSNLSAVLGAPCPKRAVRPICLGWGNSGALEQHRNLPRACFSPHEMVFVCVFFFFFRGWMFLFIRGCLMCRLKPSPQRCCGAGGRGCARLAHPTRSSFMLHTRPCTAATTDGNPRSWARTPRQRIHGEGCCLLAAAPRAGGEAGAMDPASLPASFIRLESQD